MYRIKWNCVTGQHGRTVVLLNVITINEHWVREWHEAGQATIHYRSQWWPCAQTWICVSRPQCIGHRQVALQWRHNEPNGVSNHQPHDCLLKCWFSHRSKKTSKLRVTGFCAWNSPVNGEFPAQKASNAENASIWWRHHVCTKEPINHQLLISWWLSQITSFLIQYEYY